jgi:hypothetical protein
MAAFFTDIFTLALKTTPTMMNGSTFKMYLFPVAPEFEPNDSRYLTLTTIAELTNKLGWGNYLTPSPANFTVATADDLPNRYVIRDNPVMMASTWNDSLVAAIAFEYIGPNVPMTNKLAFVTNRPFAGATVINTQDGITAQINANLGVGTSGTRDFFGWDIDNATAGTRAHPVEGEIVLFRGTPDFEPAKTQHVWMFPQRINMLANPSFEVDTRFWRVNTGGTLARASGYAPGVGGGSFYGHFTSGGVTPGVLESNQFPMMIRREVPEGWTIQFQARGDGELKVGLITFPASYEQTITDWGPDDEDWFLSNTWRKVRSLRKITDVNSGMLRLETNGTYLDIDHVCVEPGLLPENYSDWDYFDGETIFGAEGDYSWYGNRPNASYSCWINHRAGVKGRLFAWDVVKGATPDVITDEEARQQGLVYQWIPAGTPVTCHDDVLFSGDPQTPVLDVTTAVLPSVSYSVNPTTAVISSSWAMVVAARVTVTCTDRLHAHVPTQPMAVQVLATITVTDEL